jgi:DNA-binding NarL/FixJ family response regulator
MQNTTDKLQILVVDDHAIIRLGIQLALQQQFNARIVEANDAPEALEYARATRFHLILLDITMPGRSGLDLLPELRATQPDSPVLVMTMHGEEQFAERVLKAGGAGYIMKSELADELVTAVRKVLAGHRYVSEALGERLAMRLSGRGALERGSFHELSGREFEVLRMIAEGKSGKEIAAYLSLSYKTVSTYRTRLLEKLNLRTNHELTVYARREGLVPDAAM